jgi:type VI secretion system secreted protein VgrG
MGIILSMDIHTGIIAASFLFVIAAYFAIRSAIRVMQTARKLSFYSLRRMHNANAWRLFFFALFMIALAVWLPFYGEPMAYTYFPPSPTPTLIPTITPTPTITSTPTITPTSTLTITPAVTDTPTGTSTPSLPVAIEALFKGEVTPNPDAVFTAIQFSTTFDGTNPIDPKTSFRLPIKTMYGGFDYNNIIPGVQWTALWYHDGKLVCYETKPWDGGTGGIGGYTECGSPIGGWTPGEYEVQIFIGYEWKVIGRFIVLGDGTPTPTLTPTAPAVDIPTDTPLPN